MKKNLLRQYWRSDSGNFAISFAIIILVVLTGVGVAIDTSKLISSKTALQDSTDNAVLAAAIFDGKKKDKKKHGETFFKDSFGPGESFLSQKLKIKIDKDGVIKGYGEAEVSTSLMGIFGYKTLGVSSYAEARPAPGSSAEIVFVLDYSSSMNGQYESMRDAAISLIEEVTDSGQRTDISFALVPFANEVYFETDGKYVVDGISGQSWSNCTASRDWPSVITDNTPTNADNTKWGLLSNDYSEVSDKKYYEECEEYVDRNLIVQPLTNNHTRVINQLRDMEPWAGTNIPTGLEVGWQVISPNAPWIEGKSYDDKNWKKFIVLLSDGASYHSSFGPAGEYSEAQGTKNFLATCSAAKDMGVTIITVAYELDDDETQEDLESCASTDQHFLKGNEQNIAKVFGRIGKFFGSDSAYLAQ